MLLDVKLKGPHVKASLRHHFLGVYCVLLPETGTYQPVIQVQVKCDSPCQSDQLHFFYNHCKDLRGCGQPKGKEVN